LWQTSSTKTEPSLASADSAYRGYKTTRRSSTPKYVPVGEGGKAFKCAISPPVRGDVSASMRSLTEPLGSCRYFLRRYWHATEEPVVESHGVHKASIAFSTVLLYADSLCRSRAASRCSSPASPRMNWIRLCSHQLLALF
jgi:hypothetical protein